MFSLLKKIWQRAKCIMEAQRGKLPALYSLEGSPHALSTLKEWGIMPISLRAKHLHKLFGIILHGRAVSSPPFLSFFIPSFMLVWSHGHRSSFYALDYDPILLNLFIFAQINSGLVIGSSFSWFLCFLDIPLPSFHLFVLL